MDVSSRKSELIAAGFFGVPTAPRSPNEATWREMEGSFCGRIGGRNPWSHHWLRFKVSARYIGMMDGRILEIRYTKYTNRLKKKGTT